MKRRCFPLRGDHNLLTPDTHTLLGLRQCEQVQSGGVASLSGGSSSSKPNTVSVRQRPAASPTRRLRFEDETEKEAESRYLERQRQKRQTWNCGAGAVVSKPDLNLYINGTAEAGHAVGKQPRGRTVVSREGQSHTCERGMRCGVNLWQHSPGTDKRWSLNRQHLNLRTEPIRETYIGSVTSVEKGGAYTQVRRQSVELNGAQVTFHQAMPYTGLPTNPYAPHSVGMCTTHPPKLHREHQLGPEPRERREREKQEDLNNMMKNSSSSSERGADTTAEGHPPPTSEPMTAELHQLDVSLPAHLSDREDSSRLSLRRFFSTVTLSRTRTSSLDRLCSRIGERTRPAFADFTSTISRNSSSLVKKTSSVESLRVQEVPLFQSRKSSLELKKKKKKDRSANYKPAAEQFLPGSLGIKDISCPSSVRSVGRILQVCPDGTFLLELKRPVDQTFGFIISRGRGRLDSGVYIEDMNSNSGKLYAGLLAVGDEILEVNGEKVACLSLDQVTHLLIQNQSVTIRVLRHQRTHSE